MEEFLTFAAVIMKTDRQKISLDTTYGTIPQWDSIIHLRLVMEIEEKYKIEISIDKVPDIKTLAQFYYLITGGS